MTADTDVDVTPPPRPRRRRRAGLVLAAVVTGLVGLAVPAEAGIPEIPERGSTAPGHPPVSSCTSEFVEECRYPTEGYRVRAACSSLAPWTEARGISTFPIDGHAATEWFWRANTDQWSEWKPQMRLPVGSLHPRDTKVEYRPTGPGLTLYKGDTPASGDEARTVTVAMPSDASGTAEFYWERSWADHVKLGEAPVVDGRASFRIPPGAIVAGSNQAVLAAYSGDAQYPAMRTSSGGISVQKPTARPVVTTPFTHVTPGTDAELTVTLPYAEGPVDVMEGDRVVGTVEMHGGRGWLAVPLSEGEHELRVVHRGDARYLPGESATTTVTVFAPSIELESTTLQPGEELRATATLPSAASGRVQFLMTWPGNMAGIGSADVVDGKATFTIPVDRIGTGTFGLAADHRGGNGFMPSRTEPTTFTIGAADTATTSMG
ncbi:Ig-like domain-containing protein [Actinomycetospora sp. OC33-EN08]|uniref:Ig-like domain-containing protein n=1 Tax=Actinomycetospora aurantiaca TaxID=3129233 RepID=A0ABU8MVA0_9PSEU